VYGENDNDLLFGDAGNDTLNGGAGNDTLNGGTGSDSLIGGTGNDLYVVDSIGDRISETNTLSTEIDTVQSAVTWTVGANLENLILTGTVAINGTGNALNNKITANSAANVLDGGAGNDLLNGGIGNDTLLGGYGNDTLLGGTGNDWLDGGVGTDSMVGGAGNDTYVVDNIGDKTIELANEGADTVRSSIAWTLGANIENLVLAGTAAVNGTGNGLANRITGNGAANVLNGSGGNDVLTGNAGNDTLTGGAGADQFLFNAALRATNVDRITDFASGVDKIVLDDDIFTSLTPGTFTFAMFRKGAGVTSASTSAQRIVLNTANGALYYDADGNGAGAAAQFAVLTGTSTISAVAYTDFIAVT
jgi:Ca2+-binding RTX toxin-like protein